MQYWNNEVLQILSQKIIEKYGMDDQGCTIPGKKEKYTDEPVWFTPARILQLIEELDEEY